MQQVGFSACRSAGNHFHMVHTSFGANAWNLHVQNKPSIVGEAFHVPEPAESFLKHSTLSEYQFQNLKLVAVGVHIPECLTLAVGLSCSSAVIATAVWDFATSWPQAELIRSQGQPARLASMLKGCFYNFGGSF